MRGVIRTAVVVCILLCCVMASAESYSSRPMAADGAQLIEDGTWCARASDERMAAATDWGEGEWFQPMATCPRVHLSEIKQRASYLIGQYINELAMSACYGAMIPYSYPSNIFYYTVTGQLARYDLPADYLVNTPFNILETNIYGYQGAKWLFQDMQWTAGEGGVIGKRRRHDRIGEVSAPGEYPPIDGGPPAHACNNLCVDTNSVDEYESYMISTSATIGDGGGEFMDYCAYGLGYTNGYVTYHWWGYSLTGIESGARIGMLIPYSRSPTSSYASLLLRPHRLCVYRQSGGGDSNTWAFLGQPYFEDTNHVLHADGTVSISSIETAEGSMPVGEMSAYAVPLIDVFSLACQSNLWYWIGDPDADNMTTACSETPVYGWSAWALRANTQSVSYRHFVRWNFAFE
ncbi:MAG TPA: hypothetical protein P5567_14865 [Kiritimatiellia bacterium]|nr:hypothetical protein [Kiritimatiellia bacterium]HRZ13722.1 hypothetical protein [Kiritimatiellia bacterium]HSA19370.1 hypothetical protein [Kiritimatiellia bacterium]